MMDMIEGTSADHAFRHAVGRLAIDLPKLRQGPGLTRIAGLRTLASSQARAAAVELIDALGAAIAHDRAGTPVRHWLSVIEDAGIGRAACSAAPLYLATIGARIGC